MRVMVLVAMLVVLSAGKARGEVSCFRTPAQAAVQVGEQEGGGYRLEFVRQDPFGRRSWATVKSCAHPEWPSVVVATAFVAGSSETPHGRDDKAAATLGRTATGPVVMGGTRVRVFEGGAMARLETVGVAQSSGRIGDRVMVRIGEDGRVVEGVVRGADVLEIGQ